MRALAEAADRVERTIRLTAGRRSRDMSGFGGPSQGPSKRGSSSSSAGSGWSGGRRSSSSSGRSSTRPVWSQQSASTGCYFCGQTGHLKKDCPLRGQTSGPTQRSGVTCFQCGQPGHYRSECPLLTVGTTTGQVTGAQQGQSGRGHGQTRGGASSSAAGSSLSSGVQSTFRGRRGRNQRGQPGRTTTQARVFSMTQQEAQATPDVITGNPTPPSEQAGPSRGHAAWDYFQ